MSTKRCPSCSGSGYYDNAGSPKCGCCNGSGFLEVQMDVPHPYKYVRFWHSNALSLLLRSKDMSFDAYIWDRMCELTDLGINVISSIMRDPLDKPEEAIIRIQCTDEEYRCIIDLYAKNHPFDYYPPNHVDDF